MSVRITKRHPLQLSQLFVAALVILSLTLGLLQYRWIGEVSRAESERLTSGLHISLQRFAQDFNAEIAAACAAVIPDHPVADRTGREQAYAARFTQWQESSRRRQLFRTLSPAVPVDGSMILKRLDPGRGEFLPIEWPAEWSRLRERLAGKIAGPGLGRPFGGPAAIDYPDLIEVPYFEPREPGRPPTEAEWLVFELDLSYGRASAGWNGSKKGTEASALFCRLLPVVS
jgi:hypothetical protein